MALPKPFYSIPFWQDYGIDLNKKPTFIKNELLGCSEKDTFSDFSKQYLNTKYTKPDIFNTDQFQCQQCDKPVDKFTTTNNYENNSILLEFWCHSEIYTISISFELFESIYAKPGDIFKYIGPVFSNPIVAGKTEALLYLLKNPIDEGHLNELITSLKFYVINSREAQKLVIKDRAYFGKHHYQKALDEILSTVQNMHSAPNNGYFYKKMSW